MPKIALAEQRFQRNLDWNLLKVFVHIARECNISQAARQLARGQPAISMSLRRLEGHLGVALCRRSPSGLHLTDQGQILAELCSSLEALVRQIPGEIASPSAGLKGMLRVALVSSLATGTIDRSFAALKEQCPLVELAVEVAPWDTVQMRLLRRAVDVGLAPARFMHPDLQYELLVREPHGLFCGRNHHLYGRSSLSAADLADEDFILTGADEPDALRDFRVRYALGMRISGRSDHLDEVRRLISAGLGIGLLPKPYVEAEVERGDLWPLTMIMDEPTVDIYVITQRNGVKDRLRDALTGLLRTSDIPRRPLRVEMTETEATA